MAQPAIYVVGDHSTPNTPDPDLRGVVIQTSDANDGQPVYKSSDETIFLWFDSGDDVWKVTEGVGNDDGFMSETTGSGGLVSDYTEISGAQSGQVGVTAGTDNYVRYILRESEATMVYIGQAGIPRTKELHRRWDNIKDRYAQDCVDFLYTWTSAKNWQEQYYVDDPMAVGPRGSEVWPGRWRLVTVSRTADAPQGITQILRLGYQQYTGDPADPIDQSEARLGKGMGNTVTGDYGFIQEWRYTDPDSHDEFMVNLTAIKTVTDPVVEGETIIGTFACSEITSQPNEDGSILIRRTLNILHTITSPDGPGSLEELNPVISQEEEFINRFAWEPGDEEKLIYVYSNIDPASREYLMETITVTELENIVNLPPDPDETWILYDRLFENDEKSGVAKYTLLWMKETWDADYTDDKRKVRGNTVSGWLRDLTLQVTGVSQAQAVTDFNTLILDYQGEAWNAGTTYSKGDAVTHAGEDWICTKIDTGTTPTESDAPHEPWIKATYLLNSRDVQHNGRGEYVVTGQMGSVYNGIRSEDAVIVRSGSSQASSADDEKRVGVRVWFRRSFTAKEELIGTGGEATLPWTDADGVDYEGHHWEVQDHQDGAYTVRQYGYDLNDDDEDDYFVARIKPTITPNDQALILRVWPKVTEAFKDQLIHYDGPARNDFDFDDPLFEDTVHYTHADCWVDSRGADGYNVRQLLVYLREGLDADDAIVTRIDNNLTTDQQKIVVRTWATVTEAEKNSLVAGIASANFPYDGQLYYHSQVFVDDRGRAGYTVRQIGVTLSTDSTEGSALTVRFKGEGSDGVPVWTRAWLHRTTTAKDALMAGPAISDSTVSVGGYNEWIFFDVRVEDRGAGGYHVTQTLRDFSASGAQFSVPLWDISFAVKKTFTQSGNEKTKVISYTKKLFMRPTEKQAWEELENEAEESEIVAGSETVVRGQQYGFLAKCLVNPVIGAWAEPAP